MVKTVKVRGGVTSLTLTRAGDHFFVGTEVSQLYLMSASNLEHELRMTCHTGKVTGVALPRRLQRPLRHLRRLRHPRVGRALAGGAAARGGAHIYRPLPLLRTRREGHHQRMGRREGTRLHPADGEGAVDHRGRAHRGGDGAGHDQ